MGTKVKDFLEEQYREKAHDDPNIIREMNFKNYMLAKMEELGEYAKMDVSNFGEDFYANQISAFSDFGMKPITFYCYNKVGDDFNLIYFIANPSQDIFLSTASTCKIDLSKKTFEYNLFEQPTFLRWEVNIIQQRMSGELPFHLFDTRETDNITKGVIRKDFNEEYLAHNCVYEIHSTIEKSKNNKEYVYDNRIMWESNPRITLDRIRREWHDMLPYMDEASLWDIQKWAKEKPSGIDNVERLLKYIGVVDYRRCYNIIYSDKPKKALMYIMGDQN